MKKAFFTFLFSLLVSLAFSTENHASNSDTEKQDSISHVRKRESPPPDKEGNSSKIEESTGRASLAKPANKKAKTEKFSPSSSDKKVPHDSEGEGTPEKEASKSIEQTYARDEDEEEGEEPEIRTIPAERPSDVGQWVGSKKDGISAFKFSYQDHALHEIIEWHQNK